MEALRQARTNVVDGCVRRLRHKLGHDVIATLRNVAMRCGSERGQPPPGSRAMPSAGGAAVQPPMTSWPSGAPSTGCSSIAGE